MVATVPVPATRAALGPVYLRKDVDTGLPSEPLTFRKSTVTMTPTRPGWTVLGSGPGFLRHISVPGTVTEKKRDDGEKVRTLMRQGENEISQMSVGRVRVWGEGNLRDSPSSPVFFANILVSGRL